MEVVKQIYKLRQNFILIGLTRRTASGCSTVAKILATENVQDLKSNYRDFNEGTNFNHIGLFQWFDFGGTYNAKSPEGCRYYWFFVINNLIWKCKQIALEASFCFSSRILSSQQSYRWGISGMEFPLKRLLSKSTR